MIRIWDLSMLSLRRRKKFLVYELLSGGDLHYHLERSRSGEAHRCFPWRFFIRPMLEGLHLLLGSFLEFLVSIEIILDHQSMSFVDICCLLATHLGGETRFTPLFTPLLKFHELLKMSMFSQVSFSASRRRIAAYDASKGLFHMANLVPAMYHRDIKPLNIVLDKPHPQNPVQVNWFHCEFLVKNPINLCFLLWKNRRKGTAKMVDFGVQDSWDPIWHINLPRIYHNFVIAVIVVIP